MTVAVLSNTPADGELQAADQTVFDSIPDTVFDVDSSGIIHRFKAADRFSSFLPQGEVAGRHISAVLPASAVSGTIDGIAAALETGELQILEYLLSQSSVNIYVEIRIAKLGANRVLIIIRDISEWLRFQACDLLMLDIAGKVQLESSLAEILHVACQGVKSIFGAGMAVIAYKDQSTAVRLYSLSGRFRMFGKSG